MTALRILALAWAALFVVVGAARADQADRALAHHCPHAVEFAGAVRAEARRHLLHPVLLVAIMRAESNCTMTAIGGHGERCAFQLHGVARAGLSVAQLLEPETCIAAGAKWVAEMQRWCGSVSEGLGAYNTGLCPRLADERGKHAKARAGRRYARRVLSIAMRTP